MDNLQNSNEYTIPKPSFPPVLYLYGGLLVAGLLTLFVSAYSAFSSVMSPQQSFLAALVVEGGMLAEAFSAISSRNRLAVIALIVSLGISLTYNFIQASTIGERNGINNITMISVLALGPIFAIVTLSFAFGGEYRKYQERIDRWSKDRQDWIDSEQARRDYNETKLKTTKMRLEAGQTPSPTIRDTSKTVFASDGQTVGRQVPTFQRGLSGFKAYLSWIESQGETFSKRQAAVDLNLTPRSIDRFVAELRENKL